MRRVTPKEIDAVLRLDGRSRFERFIKVVADTEQAWGLRKDGWAAFVDDDGRRIVLLWPAREYAELCRPPDWLTYDPVPISLDALLMELLPGLRAQGASVGVFPTPTFRGETVTSNELEAALRLELDRYA